MITVLIAVPLVAALLWILIHDQRREERKGRK